MFKKIMRVLVGSVILMMMAMVTWVFVADWLLPVLAVKSFKKNNIVPTFTEIDSGFTHSYRDKTTFPMVGVTAFDWNNDGSMELLVTGAAGQKNAILSYQKGVLKNVIGSSKLSEMSEATYGFEVVDLDNDGDDDIVAAQQNGVFIYENIAGNFNVRKIPINFEDHVVALDVQAADVDKDNFPDLYISTFKAKGHFKPSIFNDEANKSANIYLHNNGDGTFADQTKAAGLTFRQNTFLSRFVDLDKDGYVDLILAPNTDQVRIYQNNKNGTFIEHIVTDFGFWMGIATSDIDGDGDVDIFLSNVGSKMPDFMVSKDSTKDQVLDKSWRMLENLGGFKFKDITVQRGLDENVLAWGAEFADFNKDKRPDLIVTENFIGLPKMMNALYKTPGKLLIQGVDGKYVATERQSGVTNRLYGYTPLPIDINGDGYMDLVIANQNGPLRVFINDGKKQVAAAP